MTLFGNECPGHNPSGGAFAEEPSEPDFCDGACVRTTPITNEQYEQLADDSASCPGEELSPNPCRCGCAGCMHNCAAHTPVTERGGTIMIVIEIDKGFSPHNGWTDSPELERETADKIRSGEWEAYAVGLMREGEDGMIRADYSTFVWGAVCPAGSAGLYAEPSKIRDEHLRSLAEQQLANYGEASA